MKAGLWVLISQFGLNRESFIARQGRQMPNSCRGPSLCNVAGQL